MPLPPPPPKLLAVDPGRRRVGVAVSDDLGMFAHPRDALLLEGDRDPVEAIARLFAAEQADELIVGLPIGLSGADTSQTEEVRALALKLRSKLGIQVTLVDERYSSVQAARDVKGSDRRKRGELDSAAATLVLQSVLDRRRNQAAS